MVERLRVHTANVTLKRKFGNDLSHREPPRRARRRTTMNRVRIGASIAGLALVAGCATAAGTTSALAGGPPRENCPPTKGAGDGVVAIVDYIDFIQAFDQQYDVSAIPVHKHQLGRIVLRWTCSLSALFDRSHQVAGKPREGNTAFLPVGTPIYAIDGWPARCRLAARLGGKLQTYLAMRAHTKHAKPRACALHH
jgi:hypothetical protein